MTDLQAMVTSVAIVKSGAVDMRPPGPDYEHGLGRLSLECINRYDDEGKHIGFADNPLSVIKDDISCTKWRLCQTSTSKCLHRSYHTSASKSTPREPPRLN